jgi:hypothetical protein
VSKLSGTVRLVSKTTSCRKGKHGEFAATWNQKGQPGVLSGPAGGDLSGSYPDPAIAAGAVTDAKVAAANIDGAAGTPSLRRLGTGSQQAAAGNDPRFDSGKVRFLLTGGSAGPGPISFDITKVSSNSYLLVTWFGTGFSATANSNRALCLTLDSNSNIVDLTELYFNNASEHLAFPAHQGVVNATAGPHVLSVEGGSNCNDSLDSIPGATVDINDHAYISVLEVTPPS